MEPFCARLRFHGDLHFFLKASLGGAEIRRELTEPTSVKDVIESCGVPHTEIDRITVDGTAADFSYVLRKNADINLHPVDVNEVGRSGLQPRRADRFVADGHLGKLTRNLRLLGFDVAYGSAFHDAQLLNLMQSEQRCLLTRDRRLLMHRIVTHGYCPRSSDPMQQTVEVVRRFNLINDVRPFARCVECNGLLAAVDKADVLDQLEPLTQIYYHEFRRCTGCGKIFWRGSHFSKLESFLEQLQAAVAAT